MTIIRVVDFETTGREEGAEVCEVGICDLHLEDRRVSKPKAWLCSVNSMPPDARAVHHISLQECAPFVPFDPALIFKDPCDAVAAHNAEFETKFIAPSVPAICTLKAALRVWPDAPAHNNGTLRYWLEDRDLIRPDHAMTQPPHRAGPDAYTTAHILLALFDAGITGRDMVKWTREPRLLPRCPIGKFRGKPWTEVEAGFLQWMLRQTDMEEDLKWNAGREIERRRQSDDGPLFGS